ncbi:MAG: beta-lactamase family protein [Cyclobacteriaceae bacterium]|nr:beta-lactamase family protein [Cyclobacteriaceae bacterium]
MRRIRLLSLLMLLCYYSCTQKGKNNNPGFDNATEERIDRIISNLFVEPHLNGVYQKINLYERLKFYHTPGVSIAVINDGKVEWARGFGLKEYGGKDTVNIHTLFQAGSVSKPVFALLVMKLVQEGRIDLDTDVNTYLKTWKVPGNDGWQPVVTLRQLLSHTAGATVHGFPGYMEGEAVPTLQQVLNGEAPANTSPVKITSMPGTVHRYSGGGFTAAQVTVIDHIGEPLPRIANRYLFEPLGLSLSTYEQPLPPGKIKNSAAGHTKKYLPVKGRFYTYPEMAAAGLWTTPTELAAILIEINMALKDSSAVLAKAPVSEMLTPQPVANYIGIGFYFEGSGDDLRIHHDGWDEGFVAQFKMYVKDGKGAVVMLNSNEGYDLMGEIFRAIAHEYDWPGYLPPQENIIRNSREHNALTGTYYDEAGNHVRITGDNEMYLVYNNQNPMRLQMTKAGHFVSPVINMAVTFDEQAGKLTLRQGWNQKLFKRKNN